MTNCCLCITFVKFSDNLHSCAIRELEKITEYSRLTMGKLSRKVEDLDSLRFMMDLLKEVREKESSIEMEINPVKKNSRWMYFQQIY